MKSKAITLIEALEPRTLLSVSLVKDINTAPGPLLGVWDMEAAGSGTVYMGAEDTTAGWELYKSDGTTAGTTLVKDIRPGRDNSQVGGLTYDAGSDTVYFTADDGVHGFELWKSDGTDAGTVLVKDINPGLAASSPSNLILINDTLYFTANNGTSGAELWKSDGTDAGTMMVKDIYAGATGSNPGLLVNNNGTLFFRATDSSTGAELWKSDGTVAGTVEVKDIYPGFSNGLSTSASTSNTMALLNGYVYFGATSSSGGQELWRSDGTAAGTTQVADLTAGSASSFTANIKTSGNYVYFNVGATPGLWRTDGTSSGTQLIMSGSTVNTLDVSGTLFFAIGTTLYTTTGSGATTVMSGLTTTTSGTVHTAYWSSVSGSLWLLANDASGTGDELWKSDGTAAGTFMVKDINPGSGNSSPFMVTPYSGGVLFNATEPTDGFALWKSDGTAAGTQMVKDIDTSTDASGPIFLTVFKDRLYFRAYVPGTGVTGGEIYYSDGTEAGTDLLVDLNPGLAGSDPADFKVWGDYLYFTATNGSTGHELWRTDGTAAGTTLVADINPGAADSDPFGLTVAGNYLYFSASTFTNKYELWRTDGTAAGTIKLTTISPSLGTSSVELVGDAGGTLYFTATNSSNFTSLWKSDGSVAGTVPYNSSITSVGSVLNVNGSLFFAGTTSTTGSELYRIDPGAAAPVLVKDVYSGSGSSTPQFLTYLDGTIYFNATNGSNGRELWKTDGTAAGTVMVKDVNPGSGNGAASGTGSLVAANGLVYFRGDDGVHGVELWRSDGTAAGTYMVKDITPTGATSGNATRLFALNGYVYFAADDGIDGVEAWRSDGTAAGTAMLADLYPENSFILVPANARFFTAVGNEVYYVYNDDNHGDELWNAGLPDFAELGANGALSISATGGDDVITLADEPGGLVVTLNGMTQTFSAGAVSSIHFAGHGGHDFVDVAGGTITFANDIGADTPGLALRIGGGAGVVFDSTQHIANLQINGGSASISAGGGKVLVLNDVSIASGALDLNDNDLIVRGGAVGTWNGSAYNGVSGLIQSGAIASSAAQSHRTALAVAGAGSLFAISGSQTGTFDGETVNGNDVLVKFTYAGDANLDGKVNIDDYGRIDSNVGQSGVVFGWYNGDFNFDGKINIDDYGIIDSVIGAQGPVV